MVRMPGSPAISSIVLQRVGCLGNIWVLEEDKQQARDFRDVAVVVLRRAGLVAKV